MRTVEDESSEGYHLELVTPQTPNDRTLVGSTEDIGSRQTTTTTEGGSCCSSETRIEILEISEIIEITKVPPTDNPTASVSCFFDLFESISSVVPTQSTSGAFCERRGTSEGRIDVAQSNRHSPTQPIGVEWRRGSDSFDSAFGSVGESNGEERKRQSNSSNRHGRRWRLGTYRKSVRGRNHQHLGPE